MKKIVPIAAALAALSLSSCSTPHQAYSFRVSNNAPTQSEEFQKDEEINFMLKSKKNYHPNSLNLVIAGYSVSEDGKKLAHTSKVMFSPHGSIVPTYMGRDPRFPNNYSYSISPSKLETNLFQEYEYTWKAIRNPNPIIDSLGQMLGGIEWAIFERNHLKKPHSKDIQSGTFRIK